MSHFDHIGLLELQKAIKQHNIEKTTIRFT